MQERDAKGHFISKKKKELAKENQIAVDEIVLQEEPDNSKPFQKRLQQINSIFKLKEQQKTEEEIASKVGVAKSYVIDVLQKGYEVTETELRQQYHIPEDPIVVPQEESEIPDPKPKVVKEPKTDSKKQLYRDAIVQVIKEAEQPLTAEQISEKVASVLNSDRKSWGSPIADAKTVGLITYDKETKLYSVV